MLEQLVVGVHQLCTVASFARWKRSVVGRSLQPRSPRVWPPLYLSLPFAARLFDRGRLAPSCGSYVFGTLERDSVLSTVGAAACSGASAGCVWLRVLHAEMRDAGFF